MGEAGADRRPSSRMPSVAAASEETGLDRLRPGRLPRTARGPVSVPPPRGAGSTAPACWPSPCSSPVCCATGSCSRTWWRATRRSWPWTIPRPIVICGLPRTGTTHLHNLLSADPALRSLPYWESLEPVLAESERPELRADPIRRVARTESALDFVELGHARVQADARDDGRPRPRGDPTPGHGHLVHAVRDHRPHADLARPLPGPRPDGRATPI